MMASFIENSLVSWLNVPGAVEDPVKNTWDIIFSAVQLAVVVTAAIWGYFRFRKERTHNPRVEFSVDATIFPPQEGTRLVEFRILVNNKGAVIHRFQSIKLRVRGIPTGAAITNWETHEPRAYFPEALIKGAEVIHKEKYDHIFVEPGVEQTIAYCTIVPASMAFISAHVAFHYDEEKFWPHSAERVFAVNDAVAQPAS